MDKITARLAFDGAHVAHRVGAVIISVTRVTTASYRAAVLYGSTGAEVGELTSNYDSEQQARSAAREVYRLFIDGATVAQVLAQLARARTTVVTPVVDAAPAIVLVPRVELPRPAGATSPRMSAAQYRLLSAALHGGTAEIARGEGEASVSTLRALARAGFAELDTDASGAVIGARVTGWGWRSLAWETARRAGKVPAAMVPVPIEALASPVRTLAYA